MHTQLAIRDVRKVSLWLGHASHQSTEIYLRADPTEKLEALAAVIPPTLKPGCFKAPDKLLAMLKAKNGPRYARHCLFFLLCKGRVPSRSPHNCFACFCSVVV